MYCSTPYSTVLKVKSRFEIVLLYRLSGYIYMEIVNCMRPAPRPRTIGTFLYWNILIKNLNFTIFKMTFNNFIGHMKNIFEGRPLVNTPLCCVLYKPRGQNFGEVWPTPLYAHTLNIAVIKYCGSMSNHIPHICSRGLYTPPRPHKKCVKN